MTKILKLSFKKATRISDIPAKILKEHINVYLKNLTMWINDFFENAVFTDELADVFTVFKKDKIHDKENYRTVSTLSHKLKTIETNLCKQISGLDIESTGHYLLHCPTYITERRTLLSTIENIDNNLLDVCEPVLIKTFRFGSNLFDSNANTNVLNATIEYVLSTKRFEEPLF